MLKKPSIKLFAPGSILTRLLQSLKARKIGEISLARMADPTMRANVMDAMGGSRAVGGLLVACVGDCSLTKHRVSASVDGVMGFLSQRCVEGLEALWTRLSHHQIITRKGPHLRALQGLVDKPATGGLGRPVVHGDRPCALRVSVDERPQDVWRDQPCAWGARGDVWRMLMTPPKTTSRVPPGCRSVVCEAQLAWTNGPPSGHEPGSAGCQIGRLPKAEVDGIRGEVITGMARDQMVCPDITLVGCILERGHLLDVLAIMESITYRRARAPLVASSADSGAAASRPNGSG